MTYTEFVINVTTHFGTHRHNIRFGQAVYNCLATARPEIASQLIDTPLDPFHKNKVGEEVWEFIRERW